MKVRTLQGDTLDLVCWRTYGKTRGATEQVLLANPGLAEMDPTLPIGTLVEMPVLTSMGNQPNPIRLWD
jgi:phage tail protein X